MPAADADEDEAELAELLEVLLLLLVLPPPPELEDDVFPLAPGAPPGVTVAAASVLVDPVRLAMAESLLAVAECPPCPDCPDLEDDPPTEESLRGG